MHKIFVSLLLLLNGLVALSQTICERLISLEANTNKDSLYYSIESQINENRKRAEENNYNIFFADVDYGIFSITRENTIAMPCVRFVSMEYFNENSSIYDHIEIDISRAFVLAELNRHKKLIRLINMPIYGPFEDGIEDFNTDFSLSFLFSPDSFYHWRDEQKMRASIKCVLKENPELLVFNTRLGGGGRRILSPIHDILFVKEGRLYLFRTSNRKIYELNEYAHTKFDVYGSLLEWE